MKARSTAAARVSEAQLGTTQPPNIKHGARTEGRLRDGESLAAAAATAIGAHGRHLPAGGSVAELLLLLLLLLLRHLLRHLVLL